MAGAESAKRRVSYLEFSCCPFRPPLVADVPSSTPLCQPPGPEQRTRHSPCAESDVSGAEWEDPEGLPSQLITLFSPLETLPGSTTHGSRASQRTQVPAGG